MKFENIQNTLNNKNIENILHKNISIKRCLANYNLVFSLMRSVSDIDIEKLVLEGLCLNVYALASNTH